MQKEKVQQRCCTFLAIIKQVQDDAIDDNKKAAEEIQQLNQFCIYLPLATHHLPLTSPSTPPRYLSSFLNWPNQLPLRKPFGFRRRPGMWGDKVALFRVISKNRLPGE